MWEGYGGKLTAPTETNMVWFDLAAAGTDAKKFIEDGERVGLRLMGGRLVVHYQIGDEAIRRLDELMQVVLKGKKANGKVEVGAEKLVADLAGDCP
jgi:threonine aldolase